MDLPITNERGELDKLSPAITRAIMLWPLDPQSAIDFVHAQFTAKMREGLDQDDGLRRDLEHRGMLSRAALWDARGDLYAKLLQEANARIPRAAVAAEVLAAFLASPIVTSVNRAVKRVADSRKGPGNSRSSVIGCWSDFRCASHLWLAAISGRPGRIWMPETADDLTEFLTMAEAIRRKAAEVVVCPPGQRRPTRPLLAPGEVWTAPAALGLTLATIQLERSGRRSQD